MWACSAEQLRVRIIRRCTIPITLESTSLIAVTRSVFSVNGHHETSFTHSFSPLYPLNDSATIITHHAP
ncbi:hypothetical protein RK56_028225 [Escherichia coli]|nr:hypothetical protein RK56_028225 [Escherichia coli]